MHSLEESCDGTCEKDTYLSFTDNDVLYSSLEGALVSKILVVLASNTPVFEDSWHYTRSPILAWGALRHLFIHQRPERPPSSQPSQPLLIQRQTRYVKAAEQRARYVSVPLYRSWRNLP
jgi:hypothetical protein